MSTEGKGVPCYVFSLGRLLRIEPRYPRCQVDYCKVCGTCLWCNWEKPCKDGEEHLFQVEELPGSVQP